MNLNLNAGELLKEQEEFMKLEAIQDKIANLHKAERYRHELGQVRKMALRKEHQREQEELAQDMEMIERVKREIREEQDQISSDKKRLHHELEM
jgi:hypothetical protein